MYSEIDEEITVPELFKDILFVPTKTLSISPFQPRKNKPSWLSLANKYERIFPKKQVTSNLK